MKKRIIVIGTGIAGITAVKAIREVDFESDIYMIGEENYYPYYRIKLSKNLFGDLSEEKIKLQNLDWYSQNHITTLFGESVLSIGAENKEVTLASGKKLEYDKLLLANGARNFRPPIEGIELERVFSLRNLKDANNLRGSVTEGDQIVVIGGGIQGLETAWSLYQKGVKASVVELLPRLMPNQLDEKASDILKQNIEACGVKVYLNTKVKSIYGDKGVEGIITDSGMNLPCTALIYSVGITPNTDIVFNTPVKFNKGIIVNEHMETSLDGIFAAGDVAEFNGRISGSWNTSMSQGKVAGYNITGKNSTYKQMTSFVTLNAFNTSMYSIGSIDESKAFKVISNGPANGTYVKAIAENERIVGAITINEPGISMKLKSAIEKELPLSAPEFDIPSIKGLNPVAIR